MQTNHNCMVQVGGKQIPVTEIELCGIYPSCREVPVSVGVVSDHSPGPWKVEIETELPGGFPCDFMEPGAMQVDVWLGGRVVSRARNVALTDFQDNGVEGTASFLVLPESRFELFLDGEWFGWDPNKVVCSRVIEVNDGRPETRDQRSGTNTSRGNGGTADRGAAKPYRSIPTTTRSSAARVQGGAGERPARHGPRGAAGTARQGSEETEGSGKAVKRFRKE